jgi:transcriptional regulator CtsR
VKVSVLSDHIESFIKELLIEEEVAELQRNELAQQFHCAPSQINYVLTTRFSPSRGYIIESRRGGGGYIRVIRLDADRSDYIAGIIENLLSQPINNRQMHEILDGLVATGFIEKAMKDIALAAMSDKALAAVGEKRDEVRASILKEVLISMI